MNAILKSAFILNFTLQSPKRKPTEEDMQDAKILYYYPPTIPINDTRTHVAITEGYALFFGMFKGTNTSQQIITTSTNSITVTLMVEPNIYLSTLFIYDHVVAKSIPEFDIQANIPNYTDPIYYKNITLHLYNALVMFYGPL